MAESIPNGQACSTSFPTAQTHQHMLGGVIGATIHRGISSRRSKA